MLVFFCQGKSRPFSSLLGPQEKTECNNEEIEASKGGKGNTIVVIDKGVLEQFKHTGTGTEKEHCLDSSSVGEAECCNISNMQESRKRKNFEGSLSNFSLVCALNKAPCFIYLEAQIILFSVVVFHSLFLFICLIGENEKYITRKHFAFLGGDPKSKQRRRVKNFDSKEKPPPIYNHCQYYCIFF